MFVYEFSQNNSGGVFTGPAACVFVRANSPQEANEKAEAAGVNFSAPYCVCCGPRWSRASEHSTTYPSEAEAVAAAHMYPRWITEGVKPFILV